MNPWPWFVVVPKFEQKREFSKTYETLEEAEKEAARLCVKEKGEAWVCRVVGRVQPKEVPVEWSRVEAL